MMDASNRWLLGTLLFGVFGFAAGALATLGECLGEDTVRGSLREAVVKGGRWRDWRFQNMWERIGLMAFILGCCAAAFVSRFHAVGEQPEEEKEERREKCVEHPRPVVGEAARPARVPLVDRVVATGSDFPDFAVAGAVVVPRGDADGVSAAEEVAGVVDPVRPEAERLAVPVGGAGFPEEFDAAAFHATSIAQRTA